MAIPSSLPNPPAFNDEAQNIRNIQEQYTRGSLRLINGTDTAIKKLSEQIEALKQQIKAKEVALFSSTPEGSLPPYLQNCEPLKERHQNLCNFIDRLFEQKTRLKTLEVQLESLSARLAQLNYSQRLFSSATPPEKSSSEAHSSENQQTTAKQNFQKLSEEGYKLLLPIENQLQENSKQTETLPAEIERLRSRL